MAQQSELIKSIRKYFEISKCSLIKHFMNMEDEIVKTKHFINMEDEIVKTKVMETKKETEKIQELLDKEIKLFDIIIWFLKQMDEDEEEGEDVEELLENLSVKEVENKAKEQMKNIFYLIYKQIGHILQTVIP